MSDTLVLVILAAVALLAVAAWAWAASRRRRRLQDRFGPEYEREVEHAGDRRSAERALQSRIARHDALGIRPLDPRHRTRFARQWRAAQARFVDEPRAALADADRLVQEVMVERGYPTGSFRRQAEDLSVEHADLLGHYRAAHSTVQASRRGKAGTEEQRQALVHYRALFDALLEDDRDHDHDDRPDHDDRDHAPARATRRHA